MARISNRVTYPQDANLENGDYLLGTDVEGGMVATRTYSLESLRTFIETGIDVRKESGAFHLPIISRDGQRVQQSNLRQFVSNTTTGNTTFDSTRTGDDDHNHLDADLINDGVDGLTLNIYDYEQEYYLPSFAGKSYTITTAEGTFVGTFAPIDTTTSSTNPNGYINTGNIGTETAVTVNNINGRSGVHTLFRFRLNETPGTAQPVRSPQIVQSIVVGPGLEFLTLAVEADLQTRAIRVDGDADINGNTNVSGTLNVGGNTELAGNLAVAGNTTLGDDATTDILTVNASSQFNNTVTLGTDGSDGVGEVDLHIHGDMHFDDDQGGIIFGSPDPSVTLTTDGNNLSFGGNGNINIGNDVAFTDGHNLTLGDPGNITIPDGDIDVTGNILLREDAEGGGEIRRFAADGSRLPDVRPVYLNGEINAADGLRGTAHTVQVGNSIYDIPIASSQVAQVLPGLHEDLSPTPNTVILGALFYGTDEGTFVNWESGTQALTAETIASGVTTYTLTVAGNQGLFNTAFSGVPTSQRLFFVAAGDDTTNLPTSAGTRVSASQVFEVVYYDHSTTTLTFSLIGSGEIVISSAIFSATSPTINTPNLPSSPAGASTFVFTDLDADGNGTGRLSRNTLTAVAGAQAQQTITPSGGTSSVLSSIEYVGNHNARTTGGALTLDVTGRYNSANLSAESTADFTASAFGSYILGLLPNNPDSQAYAATVTLPAGNAGDSIKFVNLSTVGTNGVVRSSGTWRLIPAAGERIMKLSASEELILNDPSANFELIYSNANDGWLLIGTN